MKILFYVEPLIELGKPYWKKAWADWCLHMIRALGNKHEYWMLINEAIAEKIGLHENVNIVVLSQKELLTPFPGGYIEASSSWYWGTYTNEQLQYHVSLMKSKVKEKQINVIITFTQVPFFKVIYPTAKILHMEYSIFSRKPFPETWYLDVCGVYEHNYLNFYRGEIKRIILSDAQNQLVDKLKEICIYAFSDDNIFFDDIQHLREKYKFLVLLPIQFSGYYGFDCLCKQPNQFDYFTRCLEQIPEDVGVIFTMHPEYPVFDAETVSYITNRYKNAIYLNRSKEIYAASQWIMPLIDGVITVSSSLGLQTLLFNKKLIAIGNENMNFMADGHKLGDDIKRVLSSTKVNKNGLLWFFITKYAISGEYLFDGIWMDKFLKQCIEKDVSWGFYDDIDEPAKLFQSYIDKICSNKPLIPQWVSKRGDCLEDTNRQLSDMQVVLHNQGRRIKDLRISLDALNHRLNDMQSCLDDRDRQLDDRDRQLDDRDHQLNDIRKSHAWALMQKLWKIRDFMIPMNSRRRLIAKLAYKTVRSPRQMMDKLTTENVRKLWHYMRTESPAEVEARLAPHLPTSASFSSQLALLPLRPSAPESLTEYEPLAFPAFDEVAVSIIIPAYNQFDYTYNCLSAILRHTEGVCYEILLADDVSTDLTKDIESLVSNITILHNKQNFGFLRNCNAAAAKARGKYILFLNNDTQVQPNWLSPLVKLLDEHADIGMTGSKLVYPDGHLQEAGGIFWRDGSAWNYGHGGDPDAPEFNYVKDVDYISGAAIMIRRELWEDIGGFDERFVPAYCEDADLAFAVRQKGYRVIYQPLSVVVHFEGVSNGRDVKKGVKRYQVENQQKFYEKWKNVLEEENFPSGEEVFWARDRSRTKKTILVIDHYVPQWDQDAGSRTTYSYLRLWLRMGLHVLFVGDNYARLEPYATVLQQMGVEVLAGNHWSMTRFREWIKKNGRYLDYILLNRPHIAIKYIGCLRKETKAKIIYYGHDLHFLREQRQYETEKNPALLQSAAEWKEKEQALFTKADIIYAPGAYEEQVIKEMVPEKHVQAIPIYLYEKAELARSAIPDVAGRKGLLFVGGFRHQPNEDAMRWFTEEIYPLIRDKCPMAQLYIVGSNPTPYIQSLASEQIAVTGYVSDEELARLYETCRVVVSPLRFGAGIKGKIVEAMRYGIPLVTTPVGAEGLPEADSCMAIADVGDAESFAKKTLRLLEDDEAWRKQSVQEVSYMEQYFTYEYAAGLLGKDFE